MPLHKAGGDVRKTFAARYDRLVAQESPHILCQLRHRDIAILRLLLHRHVHDGVKIGRQLVSVAGRT